MAGPQRTPPTGSGRLERRKARTRAAIVEAAASLFHDQGYDETSIQQIAELADVGVGTLYGYFLSKEDLLKEVLHQLTSRAIERYSATARTGAAAIDRICRGLATFAEYIRDNRSVMLATFQIVARDHQIDAAPTKQLAGILEAIIREGIAAGTLRPVPPATTARLLVGTYMQSTLGIGVWFDGQPDPGIAGDLEAIVRGLLVA